MVEVHKFLDGRLFVGWKGHIYSLELLNVPNSCGQNSEHPVTGETGKKDSPSPVPRPHLHHPWRKPWKPIQRNSTTSTLTISQKSFTSEGYTGGHTIIRDYVRNFRPPKQTPVVYRYETKPFYQAIMWAKRKTGGLTAPGKNPIERPNNENLKPPASDRHQKFLEEVRKVHKDDLLSFDGVKYGVS